MKKFLKVKYIGTTLTLLFVGLLLYRWLEFNGSVGEKVYLLIGFTLIALIITADFHDGIIQWLKNKIRNL